MYFISLIKTRVKKLDILEIVLFLFIFVIYFISSVGLINSGDTPQYFTTEALIQHQSLDLSFFSKDPHYFIYPDYWINNGQTMSMRGFMLSVIMIPVHFLAKLVKNFISFNGFDPAIFSPNLNYEIAITSIFVGFSVAGLYYIYLLLKQYANKKIAAISIFLFAFGTYVWKYSAMYSRHGFAVFTIGLFLYQNYKLFKNKKNINPFIINLFITSIVFGVDMILFLVFAITNFCLLAGKLVDWKLFLKKRNSIFTLLIAIFFISNIALNLHLYNSPIAIQNNKNTVLVQADINKQKMKKAWLSTPLWPTFFAVLFNYKQLPKESFANYDKLPAIFYKYASVDFAKKYEFYGLFVISPFIFISLALNFKFDKNKMLGILMFLLSVILNAKVLCFWGGNQYDVRYFYPYTLFLSFFVADFLKTTGKMKNKIIKKILLIAFFIISAFSLFMGWLGVINMFKPALTGERKIWLTLSNIEIIKEIETKVFIKATFPNLENFVVAIVLFLISLVIVRKLLLLFNSFNKLYASKK